MLKAKKVVPIPNRANSYVKRTIILDSKHAGINIEH